MPTLAGEKLLDLYLQLYFYELSHREAINSRLTHSTTVLVLLGGALVFLLENAVPASRGTPHAFWELFVGFGTVALVIGLVSTAAAWWGFRYKFASDPSKVQKWKADMSAQGFDSDRISQILYDQMLTQVATTTAHNRTNNIKKSRFAAVGRLTILMAALLYGMALIPVSLPQDAPSPTYIRGR